MQQMRSVVRYDSMPLPRAYFTPEGFLRDKPILTSCGIFEYTNPDGSTRRELRLPEDVFSPESLRSYRGKPVVISHDAGLIDKDNVAENQIGTILGEGERKGDDVVAEIIIHDTDAMKSAGLKELSLGYNLDLDETPGVWNGQRFDAVQKNIRINHLALVREARAGEQARLNLDGRDQLYLLKGGKSMSKKITKTRHADAVLSDEELAIAIDEYKKRRAAAEQKADSDEEEDILVEEQPVKENGGGIEEQVAAVKERRDRRDEQGDPKDTDEAMGIIANQDEDLETLFNIIDTLLAKQDFDAADDEEVEEVAEEVPAEEEEELVEDENSPVAGVDDIDKFKKGVATDADEDEELEEIPEEEEPVDEEEELVEDADDDEDLEEAVEEFPEEEEEEEEIVEDEDDTFKDEDNGEELFALKRVHADSIDKIVSRKIALGELGEKVGLKGLARKSVKDAKKAIILAVRPDMRLDGKSDTYLNCAFDMARKEIKARSVRDTAYQKKQMFNKDSADVSKKNEDSAMSARQRMIERMQKKAN